MREDIIDFTAFIQHWTEEFTGRRWLGELVDTFLRGSSRVLLIRGEAGIGKTAFAAHLVREQNLLHHFISVLDIEWASPAKMTRSMENQISQRYGDILRIQMDKTSGLEDNADSELTEKEAVDSPIYAGEFIASPVEEAFVHRVMIPLAELGRRGVRPCILVDGIDEADIYHGHPTISEMLLSGGANFPCKFILTANIAWDMETVERNYSQEDIEIIEISGKMQENLFDCEKFVESRVGAFLAQVVDGPVSAMSEEVADICTRADGNFLYLRMLLDEDEFADIDELPIGLEQSYYEQLGRLTKNALDKWYENYAPILGVLSVVRSPISSEQLRRMAKIPDDRLRTTLDELGRFLYFDDRLPEAEREYRFLHKSLRDFLLSSHQAAEFSLSAVEYHRNVAESFQTDMESLEMLDEDYALRNLSFHNRMAGKERYPYLFEMIDPDIRQARRSRFGNDQIFRQDIAEAILAAIDLGPPEGIVELVRFGLIDAGIVSMVANVPASVLRELARYGEWQRAISLAYTGTGRTAEGLDAIIEGLLDSRIDNRVEHCIHIVGQIDGYGEDAIYAAHSYALLARAIAGTGDARASEWFHSALDFAERIPERDERIRLLSLIGMYMSAIDRDAAIMVFDQALGMARGSVEWDGVRSPGDMYGNQEAIRFQDQKRWEDPGMHFDTLSAKAKVLADLAAHMALGGDTRAESVMAEAEDLAVKIGAGGIEGLYARNTQEYLAKRKKVILGGKPEDRRPAPVSVEELERQIQMAEMLPRDQKGYFPRALIAIARELIPLDWKNAGEIMTRAEQAADHAESGYRAQLLLELARLRRQMGQNQAGEVLEQRAVQAGMGKAELLAGYSDWLVRKGRRLARDLRQASIAGRKAIAEEIYSDTALENMVVSLAIRSPQEAFLLAGEIQDRKGRYRALSCVAGYLQGDRARQIVDKIFDECVRNKEDAILLDCTRALSQNQPVLGLKMAKGITDPAKQILALLALVDAGGDEDLKQRSLDSAWQIFCQSDHRSGNLAAALLRLGSHLRSLGDTRAGACFQGAITACRQETSLDQRANIMCEIASAVGDLDPGQGADLLRECIETGRDLGGVRARGRVLSKAAGVAVCLDTNLACELLAEIRFLGRANFLDAIAQIVHPLVERYGAYIAWKVYDALLEADQFS